MNLNDKQLDASTAPANVNPAPAGVTQDLRALGQLHLYRPEEEYGPDGIPAGDEPIAAQAPPTNSTDLSTLTAVTQDNGDSQLYYKQVSTLKKQPFTPEYLISSHQSRVIQPRHVTLNSVLHSSMVYPSATLLAQVIPLADLLPTSILSDFILFNNTKGTLLDKWIWLTDSSWNRADLNHVYQKGSRTYGPIWARIAAKVFINGAYVPYLDDSDMVDNPQIKWPSSEVTFNHESQTIFNTQMVEDGEVFVAWDTDEPESITQAVFTDVAGDPISITNSSTLGQTNNYSANDEIYFKLDSDDIDLTLRFVDTRYIKREGWLWGVDSFGNYQLEFYRSSTAGINLDSDVPLLLRAGDVISFELHVIGPMA